MGKCDDLGLNYSESEETLKESQKIILLKKLHNPLLQFGNSLTNLATGLLIYGKHMVMSEIYSW